MPPRTTLNDRARKARIREREIMRLHRYEMQLNALSDADFKSLVATLEKIEKAEAEEKPFTTETLPQWKDLRKMGVVLKTREGNVLVSNVGHEIMEMEAGEEA